MTELATTADTSEPAVVVLSDWTPQEADELSRRAWRTGTVIVPVRYDGGLVLLGPVQRPGAAVCLGCAEDSRLATLGSKVPRADEMRMGGLAGLGIGPVLEALTATMLAVPGAYDGIVIAVRVDQLTVATHRVRPRREGCDLCSPLPEDSAELARITPEPCPVEPETLRQANPKTTGDGLREALFDWRHGPVAHVYRSEQLPLAVVTAEIVADATTRPAGYGRSATFADAERVAFFEAAERYTGMRPHRCSTIVEASYAELGPERAIDPQRLGLHDPQYQHHSRFELAAYSPDTRTRWVHGWSYGRRAPVAVPEHVAYFGHETRAAPRFLYETSSGCGLGNSFTEAVLYGLFEVAERDAFLMAWYAQTPLHRVAIPAEDPILPHLADRLESIGYELLLFDATNDLTVPVALVLALHRSGDPRAPRAFFAAGAHHDPRAALRSAAVEVAVDVESSATAARLRPQFLARNRIEPMLTEPELVSSLEDHVAVNTLPEARSRYEFLTAGDPEPVDWRDLWPGKPAPVRDLQPLLAEHVERLRALGLDVIAVNQTDPVLAARTGLHSAKVLVPGTLPMTFGHLYHRTRGLPRLLTVPHDLGRRPAPLRYEDLSLHPHPFP